jgi:hypothetical protein
MFFKKKRLKANYIIGWEERWMTATVVTDSAPVILATNGCLTTSVVSR